MRQKLLNEMQNGGSGPKGVEKRENDQLTGQFGILLGRECADHSIMYSSLHNLELLGHSKSRSGMRMVHRWMTSE